jgi:hypothetical protein
MFYGRLTVPYRQGKYLSSSIGIGVAGSIVAIGASIGAAIVAHDIELSRDPLGGHTVFVAYLVATASFLIVAVLAVGDFFRAARDSGRELARIANSLPAVSQGNENDKPPR